MIDFTVRNPHILDFDALDKTNVRRQLRFALHQIGFKHGRSADNAILGRTETKTGLFYRFRGRRGRHHASAAGQSHANLSGALRRSIGWRVRGHRQLLFGYGADGKPVPNYGVWVERGTRKMKPRPSLANALLAERRNTIRELARHGERLLVTGLL